MKLVLCSLALLSELGILEPTQGIREAGVPLAGPLLGTRPYTTGSSPVYSDQLPRPSTCSNLVLKPSAQIPYAHPPVQGLLFMVSLVIHNRQ